MSGGGGWISAVTVNAAGIWVEKLMDGREGGTFSCAIRRKRSVSENLRV